MNISNWLAEHQGVFQIISYVFGGLVVYTTIVAFVLYRLAQRHEARDQAIRRRCERSHATAMLPSRSNASSRRRGEAQFH